MKLEQNEVPFLFSSTTLPDVFFTEYLCETPGDYIKVYLYLVFLSKYNKEIKINDFSKKLSLPIKLIEEAFSFLENLNLITKKGNDFIVNNLQEIELHKLYTPNIGLSKEKIEDNAKKQSVAKMIEAINSTFFQGIMSPSWYNDIDLWIKKYKFDEEVMLALFRYCFEKSALHRSYVATVAEAWYANNIRTFDDLDEYFEKHLSPYITDNTETIVLGCTHYPFLKHHLKSFLNNNSIQLIDGSSGTASELKHQLEKRNLLRTEERHGQILIQNSIDSNDMIELSRKLLYLPIE